MEDRRNEPWLRKFRSSETFIVVVVSIAIFTDVFLYGMIVPIIPIALVERAGAREEDAQSWVSVLLAVYGGTLLVGSPLFGYFADKCRFRRVPFVVGLVALGASTLLFVLASSMTVLIIARGLQGLSAAAVWVVGLAIVADNVPRERVGEAMGHTTIALTWGFLLGPTIGGIMYEKLGFEGTFAIPAGLIVVDVVLRFAMIERSGKSSTMDKGKPSLFEQEPNCHHNGYNTFGDRSEINSEYSTSTCRDVHSESATLLASTPSVDRWLETNQRKATVFDLLRTPRLPLALASTVVMAVTFAALETTLPLYVMETFHWSSGGAGLIFVASSVPSFTGVYIGKAIPRLGIRPLGTAAFLLASACWILMRFVEDYTIAHIILLISLLLLLGLAVVTIEVVSMTEVFQVIEDFELEFPGAFGEKSPVAQAYALFNMAFAGGQLLGPILAGWIMVHAGWGVMTLVTGTLCGVMALPIALFGDVKRRTGLVESEVDA
ncbi:uncharacterized protein N7498_000291 [Penicillium cinerascens]|uniref:Major facilitator superfamily (MFS) profile domain-containing protein n=1 Tax=Penicillium cinerascens TaxID=70096 RepID=A0A9W9TCY5_9EURO|nr:uncharacterized protein N7498_000291 [Penicillium cinerascens]KAJ5218192.1 hypothetical protein N7498_000291 [Penicillium cinerascens]